MKKIKYEFCAKPFFCSSSADMTGWVFVSLPKDMSVEIRDNFKNLEEGWGRMKVTAKVRNTEWQTAIWFDTKQDTYLLPLRAAIRKKEKITLNEYVPVMISVDL